MFTIFADTVTFYHYCFIVRLVNGRTQYEGRVEVYHIGEWGTIGDYNWNLKDAQVVCNELGYGTAIAATTDSYFGEGNGRTWLDNVYCAGTEWSIGDCSHSNWNYGYSSHYNDVGVQCTTGNVLIIACINICKILFVLLCRYSSSC